MMFLPRTVHALILFLHVDLFYVLVVGCSYMFACFGELELCFHQLFGLHVVCMF